MIDIRQAAEVARRYVSGQGELSVIQRSDDHVVFDAGGAIVKCGTRDEFGIEAWACERARSLGVPAPEVISLDTAAPVPHLVLSKVVGAPLNDNRLALEVAARGARQAGAMLRRLHEVQLAGFGWIDREHFSRTAEVRGKSSSWAEEIKAELDPALEELVAIAALTAAQAEVLRAHMMSVLPTLETIREGRLLHGDLGRMHIFVDPQDGGLTGLVDWADVQVGDPAWDLAITACHLVSPSEGILRVHYSQGPNLFPQVLEGYEAGYEVAERSAALGSFYRAYRSAWVARLGPGEGGAANPSLKLLLSRISSVR